MFHLCLSLKDPSLYKSDVLLLLWASLCSITLLLGQSRVLQLDMQAVSILWLILTVLSLQLGE